MKSKHPLDVRYAIERGEGDDDMLVIKTYAPVTLLRESVTLTEPNNQEGVSMYVSEAAVGSSKLYLVSRWHLRKGQKMMFMHWNTTRSKETAEAMFRDLERIARAGAQELKGNDNATT